jgi:hypothetical protein
MKLPDPATVKPAELTQALTEVAEEMIALDGDRDDMNRSDLTVDMTIRAAKLMLVAALMIGSAAQASQNEWHRWFAWYPVEVDAYEVSEIRNGKMSYQVWWAWVDYRWHEWQEVENDREWHGWRYRIAR